MARGCLALSPQVPVAYGAARYQGSQMRGPTKPHTKYTQSKGGAKPPDTL